ncbi:undecaprenyl-phosphate glucose phosphotransferase [Brumicola pallidula]|uniref:Probable CPS biosynthesis glycosyltransferase n=1 Tax=Brumicola pallidula DSM 14239 = ACAM 615 TaxID=1121922 RepID=K6ZJY5_9ALTE|nr:undecaprenyl-phosphate glucose phosphotransferase [Glaciecola pallidula]GAC29203.1 probable CPS biosynthesis glycosyltransferase [Glaciecola pallidula DSM 14239 = ACAM 615]
MKKTTKTGRYRGAGVIQSNKSSFSTLYRLVDLVTIALLYFLILIFRRVDIEPSSMILLFVGIIGFNVTAEGLDLYRSWRTQSTTLLIKYTSIAWTITGIGIIAFAYFFPTLAAYGEITILMWLIATYPALSAWRIVFREFLFVLRKKGRNSRYAAIIGATPSGYNLSQQITENEHLGIRLKGIFDDREASRLPDELQSHVVGTIEAALEAANRGEIDFIYIAMPMSAENRIMDILNRCSDTTCSVYIIPNFFIYNLLNARWQTVGSVQTLSVFDTPFQGANNVLKRAEDLILSACILVLIAIPMLFIAIGIKATSTGPIIFKQNRYGLDGRQIKIYKFRSMLTEDNGEKVEQVTVDDKRVTPFGAFLRRRSLDELPQFFNVLQGRMSIVGPRPHAVAHNEQYRKLIEGYMLRHKVKPGITGWAQINGFRGETETVNKMVKRVEYDLEYIHRWSVWLDMKIITVTIFKGFVDKNAY